jgi:integrase
MPTPVRANRLAEILRKMFNLAIRWRIRIDNPAAGFARNAEAHRDRYLSTDEIGWLSAALDAHSNRRAADAVRRILLTGARRGEVLNARWDQIDLETAVWIKGNPPQWTALQRRRMKPGFSPTATTPSGGGDAGSIWRGRRAAA